MWKDKRLQLVMLPTEKETTLFLDELGIYTTCKYGSPQTGKSINSSVIGQLLCLLSDEKIKEGDVIYWNGKIAIAINTTYTESTKKIIAISVPTLKIWDGKHYGQECPLGLSNDDGKTYIDINLPQFSDSFLEEYVKRYNSKKSLEVEVEYSECNNSNWDDLIEINNNTISIRFKEEKKPCTHEVVKEAMKMTSKEVRTPDISRMEEKMYSVSLKELTAILNLGMTIRQDQLNGHCNRSGNEILADWIKENLK